MADTDILCHRACVYSSCSVRLCVIILVRRSCHTDCLPPLMRAVPGTLWLHESGESGSQSVAPRRFRLNLISPRVLTGDHTQSCTDTCERWRTHVDARQRCASTCVRACMDYGRQVDVPTAPTPPYVDAGHCIVHMLNYMLLIIIIKIVQ